MEIYLAADHGGFNLKNYLKEYFKKVGLNVKDFGPLTLETDDDYPDFVVPMIKELQNTRGNKGIVLCRNGVGVSIAANKFKGIRAALSWNVEQAVTSREDDNSNVLALPADFITTELAIEIVNAWLSTPFSNEERHKRRLDKISNLGN